MRVDQSDLRMPRAPVLSRLTGLGRATTSPTSLMARARLESEDWVVAGDCWANTSLTVLDWDHAHCQAQSDDLWLHCQPGEGPPRVLGGVHRLPSWRDSVVTARALAGQWLHPALEQRAALPFTGLALSAQPGPGGNVNVVAVNAIGDLFGMVLHLEEDEEDVGCDEAESEENSLQVERWLTDWAEAVICKSFLSKVTLSTRFPEGQNTGKIVQVRKFAQRKIKYKLPVFTQSKLWKKRLQGQKVFRTQKPEITAGTKPKAVRGTRGFLPSITNADWPENLTEFDPSGRKMINIEAVKEEMTRRHTSFGFKGFHMSKPDKPNLRNKKNEYKQRVSPLSLVIDAKLEQEEELKDEIHLHDMPQFEQINLEDFYTSSGRDDNSSRILKVMMGEQDDRMNSSRRMSNVSFSSTGAPSPAPPTEEDTTFTMASFWDDLGVDMPHVSQSQDLDQHQSDEEEFEL